MNSNEARALHESKEYWDYLSFYFELDGDTYISKTRKNELNDFNPRQKSNVIHIEPLNNFNDLNSYFLTVSQNIPIDGQFSSFAEIHSVRKKRLLNKYSKPFNWIYYTADFLLTRVSPKLKITKNLYSKVAGGKGRVLSKTEILGRLYFLGFELVSEKTIQNKWCFVAQLKEKHKEIPDYKPSLGIVITLPRISKGGKTIKVYKLRTMHPYSEFIQAYVYDKYGTTGDKANEDFRISSWGKILRKYWLDEVPMIFNLLKGDIKLVGVRPLSKTKFESYPMDLQQKRLKTKPGLLPPYYADNPTDLDGFFKCEENYIDAYLNNPLLTDFKYFFRIINNILFKGKRSA